MSIKAPSHLRSGWTLVEMMIAVGIFSISGLALATMFLFCARSFVTMSNYAVLDQKNRQAMDLVTREIRQATSFVNYTSNSTSRTLTLVNGDTPPSTVVYSFDANKQEMIRSNATTATAQVLLTNCNLLNFSLYLRPPASNSFDYYYPVDTTMPNWTQEVKIVQLTWKTSMQICPTPNVNSEDVQTARIIIRKQKVLN